MTPRSEYEARMRRERRRAQLKGCILMVVTAAVSLFVVTWLIRTAIVVLG